MKHYRLLGLLTVALLVTSCGPEPVTPNYIEKETTIYDKSADETPRSITLRFYNELPNVPYVSVSKYFQEFFKTTLTLARDGSYYKYSNQNGDYLGFETKYDILRVQGITGFNSHPDYKESNSKLFIKENGVEATTPQEKVVSLSNYSIQLFDDGEEAYVPFSLLGTLTGSLALYTVAYNGQDVYVIDRNGQLGEGSSTMTYENYFNPMKDLTIARSRDMADYVYHELCFVFDHLRGYTEHLVIGDNNLLSLGLNGALEQYVPKVKELLLSTSKADYYLGIYYLFLCLYDNGHTGFLSSFEELMDSVQIDIQDQDMLRIRNTIADRYLLSQATIASTYSSRIKKFGSGAKNFFYIFDEATKTSYIVFDSFVVDYDGWDAYYNGTGEIPVNTDTYAYVLTKMKQAKSDGAENVVLDLSCNGGGNSFALEGVVGILNGAKSDFHTNNTFNKCRSVDKHLIDINLDGNFDEADVTAAQELNFNIGILTSGCSFSCGNLLPSVLKGLGYKIIGSQSGGGSCAISIEATADGLEYVHSSYLCLSDSSGDNIDSGVPVDYAIPYSKIEGSILYNYDNFYDFSVVSNYLSTAYQK